MGGFRQHGFSLALFGVAFVFPAEALLCPATCPGGTTDLQPTPCRYHANNCILSTTANPSRSGAQDINIVVMNPYNGPAGDLATISEPLLSAAAQEIEDSSFLPGYRLKLHLVDGECSGQIATRRVIEAFSEGQPKHAVLGAACSGASEAVNDALYYYKVLQVSPSSTSVSLSDRGRFPFFTHVQLQKSRSGSWATEHQRPCSGFFHGARAAGPGCGYLPVAVLLQKQVQDLETASEAADLVQKRDARINLMALYENDGVVLLCQAFRRGMFSPDYVWMLSSGWWNQNFAVRLAGTASCPCTADEVIQAAYGLMAFDMGPMMNTNDVHGLSGRTLSSIYSGYLNDCAAFGNGKGICSVEAAGYTYDGLWHLASVFHGFLIGRGRPYSELNTDFSRESLYNISLQQDYMGATGRVRIFNDVEPTTIPPSYGDREGNILMRQIVGTTAQPLEQLGFWSAAGILWLTDLVWSRTNSSQIVACSSGTCDMSTAFIPRDRSSQCPAGSTWSNELGCGDCPTGRFAASLVPVNFSSRDLPPEVFSKEPEFVTFLLADGSKLHFDKRLVVERSKHFANMLSSETWVEGRTNVIDLRSNEQADVTSMQAVLCHFMSQRCVAACNDDLAFSVRKLADQFCLDDLVLEVETELVPKVGKDNLLKFLGKVLGSGGVLEARCLELVKANACELLDNQGSLLEQLALGMTECESCALGSFSNESGLAACFLCPAGSVGEALGAEECTVCHEGFFMNESGQSACLKCNEGTYSDESGLTECRDCPAGRTTNYQGALDAQACTCNGDLWEGQCIRCLDTTRFELGTCVTCQEGLVCDEGKQPELLPGYYTTPEAPFDVYKCLPADKCPGKAPGATKLGMSM
eukprot:s1761_g7.t2